MKIVEVRRQIAAQPAAVWAILTNADRLVSGGLGILRLDGTIATGGRLSLESASAPGRVFHLKVAECDAPRRMVWTSGAPLIFNGTRTFSLKAAEAGTEFHMEEVYHGLMLPLIWGAMPDLQPGFEMFGNGLKRMAERG